MQPSFFSRPFASLLLIWAFSLAVVTGQSTTQPPLARIGSQARGHLLLALDLDLDVVVLRALAEAGSTLKSIISRYHRSTRKMDDSHPFFLSVSVLTDARLLCTLHHKVREVETGRKHTAKQRLWLLR